MTGLGQAHIARSFQNGNVHIGNLATDLATDLRAEGVHYSHAMASDRQEIIQKWLAKVIDEKEETQAAIAKLLGLSTPQMNKTIKGGRNLRADEMLIVAAYFDAELPVIPGHGQARIAKRSNDNDVNGASFADEDDDELWQLAEKKVDAEEAKRGTRLSNEEYIDRIIKLYNTLSRRKGS
ncbi:hypothetical protein [Labrenzia sp. R5_0]|jgi:transcriptional regulator with XRE-family HTH domain|uniref:hypothetical protein n=1 Tax=Labrenzia sp. R5_0 TaxID=2821108 RepID=UPI001ADCF177|nr:hypothetical protein [Labrenzia sp. R5_0]MBO9457930.1 hypothetical protein [Labrenzia sp. R5_0]